MLPAIRRYTAEGHHYRLILSLGAPTSAERRLLMPIDDRWPLADVMAAVRDHAAATGVRATLAYVVIGGVNCSPAHARALGALIGDLRVKLNLIDVTDDTGQYRRATTEELAAFRDALAELGVPVVRRYSGGADIAAACGTLAATRRGGPDALIPSAATDRSPGPRPATGVLRRWLPAAGFGGLADDLAAAQLAAGQRGHDPLGVGGRHVQVRVGVHHVDLGQRHVAAMGGDEVPDLALGGAVLAAQVQVQARDVLGRRRRAAGGPAARPGRPQVAARTPLTSTSSGGGGADSRSTGVSVCVRSSLQTSQNSRSAGGGSFRSGGGSRRSCRRGGRARPAPARRGRPGRSRDSRSGRGPRRGSAGGAVAERRAGRSRSRSRSRGRSRDSVRGARDGSRPLGAGTGAGGGTTGMASMVAKDWASSAATSRSPSTAPIRRRASARHSAPGSLASARRSSSTRSPSRCDRISASEGSARSSGLIL